MQGVAASSSSSAARLEDLKPAQQQHQHHVQQGQHMVQNQFRPAPRTHFLEGATDGLTQLYTDSEGVGHEDEQHLFTNTAAALPPIVDTTVADSDGASPALR